MFKNNIAARNAAAVGSMCGLSYLAVYIARNLLSAVSPQMQESGIFTTEQIGSLSSAFFIIYAFGQLVNGSIGDRIKARYMISIGLACAGICNLLFATMADNWIIALAAYGISGYFLAMIYGPMTKVIAENVDPMYSPRCSLGYTFASFLGTPAAALLAVILTWKGSFAACSASLFIMSAICFAVFLLYEKQGIIRYGQYRPTKNKGTGNITVLLQYQIIKFILFSVITGVIRTTVVFWMPTYFSQHLGYTPDEAAVIFTITTLITSVTAFVAVFLYERLGHKLMRTVRVSYAVSAIFFLLLFFIKNPLLNLICMVIALIANGCVSSMIYSRYCPGLRDTGYVSSVTGFLDFISYTSASIASSLFANAVTAIGWGNLILVWFALMFVGVVISFTSKEPKAVGTKI